MRCVCIVYSQDLLEVLGWSFVFFKYLLNVELQTGKTGVALHMKICNKVLYLCYSFYCVGEEGLLLRPSIPTEHTSQRLQGLQSAPVPCRVRCRIQAPLIGLRT